MSYRDATRSIQERIAALRDELAEGERKLAPFLDELPKPTRKKLKASKLRIESDCRRPEDAADWLALEEILGAHREVVGEALKAAIRIERRATALPTAFPDRGQLGELADGRLPDPYDTYSGYLRSDVHTRARKLDPEATLHDLRAGYFNDQERPLLAEASLRVEGVPLRLGVLGYMTLTTDGSRVVSHDYLEWFAVLATMVRPSVPAMRVAVKGVLDRLKLALHLADELDAGDAAFGERFLVRGEEGAATLLLTGEVRELLRSIEDGQPVLVVEAGAARLVWHGRGVRLTRLDAAIALLTAMRDVQPKSRL
jgi:hypothetical protein